MKILAWLGLLAATTLAACEDYGPPPAPPGAPVGEAAPTAAVTRSCFYSHDIRNHTIADDHTLYFDVRGVAVYRVHTNGPCFAGATSSDPIITRSPPGTASVCRPIDLDLSISKGGAPVRCIIDSITPLSPAEIAALPKRLRP